MDESQMMTKLRPCLMELDQLNINEQFELLIAKEDKLEIKEFLDDQNISDVAELINEYPEYEAQIIANMAIHRAASVFKILDIAQQKDIVKELPSSKTAELLNELPADDRTDFLEELPKAAIRDLIKLLDPEERKITLAMLGYPEDSVGRLMTPDYVYIYAHNTVTEVFDTIRKFGKNSETIDDMLWVANEEFSEDMQKMGGTEALNEPYLDIPLFKLFKKRVGWLVILFIGEMLTATAMGYFQDEIAKAIVLALFVPLIISSGGNSGSQASTLIIQAMAVGEITITDWWRVLRREITSGMLLGTVLGIIGFIRVGVWHSIFPNIYGEHWMMIGFTVGFSLIGVVLWGTLSGSMLPIFLKRLGFDPAVSSAPFVATMVDVTGLIIYFSFAYLFLQGLLL